MDEVINNNNNKKNGQQSKQVQELASQKCELSSDEVDFKNNNNNNNNNNNIIREDQQQQQQQQQHDQQKKKLIKGNWFHNFNSKHQNVNKNNECDRTNNDKRVARSGFHLFTFGGGGSGARTTTSEKQQDELQQQQQQQHTKFVKSVPLTRLLSNSNTKKKIDDVGKTANNKARKFNTYGGKRRNDGAFLERFKSYAKEDSDVTKKKNENNMKVQSSTGKEHYVSTKLTMDSRDLFGGSRSELVSVQKNLTSEEHGDKAMRYLARSLSKLWWRRANSVDISTPDPEFKVSYLGNVLTGWAKGEGCVEKQLNTLWRNYIQNTKPDVIMRIKVCASGLKATTRQHGLTEYWANRITHCCWPKNYPGVFCWVYRHEGRKLKNELRCHAVLCNKEKIAEHICNTLKENLECALRDFKREKILKQNARLSLANAAYDNPSLPRRKILLSVGGNNYRPPLERSKSAPKLMAIEEAVGEEEGDEVEATNEPEMKPCCQKDSLYPAMTLGRRRCRRGHSIRRTGKLKATITTNDIKSVDFNGSNESFEKFLCNNNYDTSDTFEKELISYFDMQLNKNNSKSFNELCDIKDTEEELELEEEEEHHLSMIPNINTAPNVTAYFSTNQPSRKEYFQNNEQTSNILHLIQRDSMRKKAQLEALEIYNSTQEDNSLELPSIDSKSSAQNLQQLNVDSDAASLSSGYETVTQQAKQCTSPTASICTLDNLAMAQCNFNKKCNANNGNVCDELNHSDSEYSDESGYVEEKDIRTTSNNQ